MRARIAALVALAVVVGLFPMAATSAQVTDPNDIPAGRETEAVVLNGASFPEWATLGDVALKANSLEGAQCQGSREQRIPAPIREKLTELPDSPVTSSDPCTHNQYEDPDFSSSEYLKNAGTPIDRLLGYRWNPSTQTFEQIPFQVDEMFVHYISNNNSGFSFYSETDQHTTYAFDREGFRWTASDPNNPCLAQPASEVAEDPVPGLDTDDEVVFMARDAGAAAPAGARLPRGIEDSYQIAVADPTRGTTSFVYVMKALPDGPEATYGASNGYVRYERDDNADVFLFSESSYDSYGAAEKGPWYDPATGICHSAESEWKQHRPGDQATITTPRYRFRYEGRWLMTELQVSDDVNGDWSYGKDLIDQWKARAFQQRPGGQTPCCGYEEEVNNWGGSSILMGELSGPVRTIRETWGADSGTNVVRREIFYRDEIRFISFLRVHVIPPGDGIYAQWDYNAGIIERYYNPQKFEGVEVDGKNDEVFGNSHAHLGRDGASFDPNDEGAEDTGEDDYKLGNPDEDCKKEDGDGEECFDNDVDTPDPTLSGINAGLNWEQVSGDEGTLVIRTQLHKATAGTAHTVAAVPYYRDDSCFDDGTGSNPGPHLDPRDVDGDEPSDSTYNGEPRRCWDSDTDPPPPPEGDPRYYQGSIGTHGVHILLIADSDNAHTTAPVTEIDSDQRMVVLPPTMENVGERYGRQPEKPLLAAAVPEQRPEAEPEPEPTKEPDEEPTEEPTSEPTSQPSPSPTSAPRATTIQFTASSATAGRHSDDVTIEARLTEAGSGTPLVDKEVTFELTGPDGSSAWSAMTDANGTASQRVTLTRPSGSYQLTARFAGDAGHTGSADQTGFVIDRDDSSMALDLRRGRTRARLIARLVDEDSRAALAGREVEFFIDGRSFASGTTDADGVTRITIRKRWAQTRHVFRARFDGDAGYLAAAARERTRGRARR